jgi:hypothetical protein
MGIGSFFKLQKNKSFSYKPRYYNPEMEDLHRRVKLAKAELAAEEAEKNSNSSESGVSTPYVPNIKGKMRTNLITQKYTQRSDSNVRGVIVLISIALIILIFYFILKISGVFFING